MGSDNAVKLPKISILMPVYNAEKYIATAVESILEQTITDFEFIIINDGSTDGTLAILEAYAQKDLRIQLVTRENKGLVATLNEGLDLVTTPLIARMDADDISLPDRLEKQVAYLAGNSNCVALGGRTLIIDPEGDEMCVWNQLTSFDEIQAQHINTFLGSAVAHPSMMYRTSVVNSIGGYRAECYPSEDLDLLLRLSSVGSIENLSDVILKYRVHAQSICATQQSPQKQKVMEIVNQARSDRKLSSLDIELGKPSKKNESSNDLKWGWWSLNSGFLKTAKKYAKRLVASEPFSLNTWRFIYCVLRGY